MKRLLPLLVIMITVLTVSSCTRVSNGWRAFWAPTSVEESYVTDSYLYEEPVSLTPYDVVAQRRAEINEMEINDAYYAIPEPVLIAILEDIGTNTYKGDVVAYYLINQTYYDGLMKGITDRKKYTPKPDSLPLPPVNVAEKVIPIPLDSIRQQ